MADGRWRMTAIRWRRTLRCWFGKDAFTVCPPSSVLPDPSPPSSVLCPPLSPNDQPDGRRHVIDVDGAEGRGLEGLASVQVRVIAEVEAHTNAAREKPTAPPPMLNAPTFVSVLKMLPRSVTDVRSTPNPPDTNGRRPTRSSAVVWSARRSP